MRLKATAARGSSRCARRERRSKAGSAAAEAVSRSSLSPAKREFPPVRPAYFMTRRAARHAYWGAALSKIRQRTPKPSRPGPSKECQPERAAKTVAADGAMAAELDKETIAKAYARWAPVYDLVFGAVFERGRAAAIEAAERIGEIGRASWRERV